MIRCILISCGEPSVGIARAALQRADGYGNEWEIVEVKGVTPMNRAFDAMLQAAAGPVCYAHMKDAYQRITNNGEPVERFTGGPHPECEFHVQVDADMVVKPNAISELIRLIKVERGKDGGAGTWQWFMPLWDDLFQRSIAGIKIYHTPSACDVRLGGYQPIRHCEMDLVRRAKEIGLSLGGIHPYQESPADAQILGIHTCRDELTAYRNCFDRQLRARWRTKQGLEDWFQWLRPHWQLFPRWFGQTGDRRYMAGYAGLVAGASYPIPADDWGEADRVDPPGWDIYQQWAHMSEEDWVSSCYTPRGMLARWKEMV